MQKIWIILLVAVTAFSSGCQKSSSPLCGGEDPEKTLPWLKEMTDTLNTSSFCYAISRATYKNQTAFILTTCDPYVDSLPLLYDCDGNKLNLTADDYRELKFTGVIEPIWRNKQF
jgi:hypothetical protein